MLTIKFTRREIATALSASAILAAQPPVPPPQNAAPTPALTPEAELKAALDSIHQNSEQLAKFPLPMSVEPAVHFKA
jgi:hypothetical protein